MRTRFNTSRGVTLIELLVAMTLIVLVLGAVYGSYVAVAQTQHGYQQRLLYTRNATRALQQIATLLRGTYLPESAASDVNLPTRSAFQATSSSELSWITTACLDESPENPCLWHTTLRFDVHQGLLLLRQKSYVPNQKQDPSGHWERLCEDIDKLELSYLDGDRWLPLWNPKDPLLLPQSIRVILHGHDRRRQARTFAMTTSPLTIKSRGGTP